MSKSLALAKTYLGQKVVLVIDRPLGSSHPNHNFVYEVNYGYVPDTRAPDGEALDAYFLGVEKPLAQAQGTCIAIIHRLNDDDDKLIVVSGEVSLSNEAIRTKTRFQEQFFESVIIREGGSH